LSERYIVPLTQEAGIVLASDYARRLSDAAHLAPVKREALRTAVVEMAHNVLRYAGRGDVAFRMIGAGGRVGVEVVVRDAGPGISSLNEHREGHTSGGGLGAGLAAARRLVDEFQIQSTPLLGTTVELVSWAV
jgi:serine/threonine-protein kinase RsbT